MTRTHTTTGLAIFFLVGVWSLSWVITKFGQANCGPLLYGTIVCGVGALLSFAGYAFKGALPERPNVVFLMIGGVVGVGLFQICAQLAIAAGGAGKTILLIYSMPFWACALAWWRLNEVPTRPQKIGLALAVVGLFLVIAPWRTMPVAASMLALASGLCWAVGSVATRVLLKQQPQRTLISVSTWQLAVGTGPLAIAWALSPEHGLTWTPGLIGAVAYSSALCGVPAWALWGLIVKRLPMAGAGLTSLLIPMCGVVWAWLFLHEQPDGAELAGMGVILVALAISSMSFRADLALTKPEAEIQPGFANLTEKA